MMEDNELDILDLLETHIVFKDYEDKTIPFASDAWFDSPDQTILEIARILPNQLTFIYTMLHEFPNQLPVDKSFPGRIQTLIYEDVMRMLRNRTNRDFDRESKINQIWVESGGYVPTKSRMEE